MFPLFAAVLFLGCSRSPVNAERKYNLLRFGQTTRDYIQWSPVDMSSATTQFSVCTWIWKRYQASRPMVLHYYPDDSYSHGMILGDDGYFNRVVGTNLDLKSEYNVPDEPWLHVCMVWSTSDYTTRVYLNGEQIGSKVTAQREVMTGGVMCLGNWALTKYSHHIFGGDLYKMNIYNRVLTQSEIRSMSSHMCSTVEENLTANRIVKWEDILLKRRSGWVTEISSGCHEQKPRTEPQQTDILSRLQNTERELAETKANFSQRLENITISLTSTQFELDSTKQELAATNSNLNKSLTSTQVELDSTKQELAATKSNLTKSLTSTQVELDSTKQELVATKSNLTKSLTSTQDELESTKQELAAAKKNLTQHAQQLENVTLILTSTLVMLNNTEKDLAETKTDLERSEEKLESVTMSLNHTLEQLEAAKKDKVRSKWDVLFSDKFLNKKLTREMSQELKSTGNMLDLFVGMNITEKLITYLKRHHEEDMVCLNTGN